MGLFDDIRCEYPLPETEVPCPSLNFQTKDTPDQYLSHYTITKDGWLRLDSPEGEVEFVDFSGELEFYEYNLENRGEWRYKAWFRDGKLKDIFISEYTAPTGPQDT